MAFSFVTKVGILGGVIYITTKNGIWGDNSDQGVKAFQQIYKKNIEDKLPEGTSLTGYIPKEMRIIPKDFDATQTWNQGVSKSFDFLVSVPNKCTNLTSKISKAILPDK